MATGKEALSFKDWKSLKDNKKKADEKLGYRNNGKFNTKQPVSNNNFFNANSDFGIRSNYNRNFGTNFPFSSDNFPRNRGQSSFLSSNYSNGANFNNYNMNGNNCEPINDRFRNFSVSNNFNLVNKFTNSNELQPSYGYNNCNRDSDTYGRSDNFFNFDCAYPQRNMMQKPLLNPFRYGDKGNRLLQEFDKERYTKKYKKTKNNKKPKETDINIKNNWKEPEVYIPNPNGKSSGKSYIPKPKFPEESPNLTSEERKQQWKEYREAMKPFKNRDFYNAKRALQRLGKKDPSELTESETFRLKNAQEYIGEHKARLNAKYPNYVKADDSGNELGELYILKTVPKKQSENSTKPINGENCDDVNKSQPSNTESISDGVVESTQ